MEPKARQILARYPFSHTQKKEERNNEPQNKACHSKMITRNTLSQLPSILIATCAILVDCCLREDLIEERFRCQLWLWLCLLFSLHSYPVEEEEEGEDINNNLIFEVWLSLIIVSNVGNIAAFGALGPIQKTKETRKRWMFPLSAWTAMVSSSNLFSGIYDGPTQWSMITSSIQVYVISIASFCTFQWHKKRQKRLEKEWKATLSIHTTTNNNDKDFMDYSQWYNWDVITTLRWISSVYKDNDDENGTVVVQQLAQHRVHGAVLETLTVSQLLALNVPYGPACQLAHEIQKKLVRTHPQPREMESMTKMPMNTQSQPFLESNDQLQSTAWLDLHDQEYNSGLTRASSLASSDNDVELVTLQDKHKRTIQKIDPEQEKRMEAMMKERFGLDLPKLKTSEEMGNNHVEDASNSLMETQPLIQSSPISPPIDTKYNIPSAQVESKASEPTIAGIPMELLKKMPPQILDIAKRRPELVKQMLRNHEKKLQPVIEQDIKEHEELEDEYDDDDDDERTSLIRRKSRGQQEYESIRR